ncbi:MAG: FAD-dependent tricarballylate dehydrogenase TcuA [Gammaproteobacteria bacterium]|nr:FAD-dependent tricarballylate dehydrogenase TcuA [Gammaproteobacteria bacterium]
MAQLPTKADVLIIGAGNAALCAALSARESGRDVLVLERAPIDHSGGNSRFTAGAMRFVYNGVEDLRELLPDLSDDEVASADFGSYTRDQFFDDMGTVTQYRCDPALAETLIDESFPTLNWMRQKGVKFMPMYGRQAFLIDGKFKFWGGLTLEAWGGGPGLVESLHSAAARNDIPIVFGRRALDLIADDDGIRGVKVKHEGKTRTIDASAVVLASGGFEANAEWRTRYLGPGWELAKVRGTRYNTGDGIRMALAVGAVPWGNWSGCHAVGWDRNAPDFGDLAVGDGFQKHSYPLGILVNANGERFVDEGADFRNYTYAKYGREILNQPNQFAWQVFDAKVTDLLRDEYRIREVTKVEADSISDLGEKMEGVDAARFARTVKAFNDAIETDVPFNPAEKDHRATRGLAVEKSNWANPLDTPPFVAYQTTCGITFTFGGLRIDTTGRVLDEDEAPIPGLFAAGELVGGLFYFNYPGGTGLTSGAVFGRIAGRSAAAFADKPSHWD